MKTRWLMALILLTLVAGVTVAGSGKRHQAELTRPIELGVSGGNADSPVCFAGTLGCLVTDGNGKTYILSNNHVFSRDINDGQDGDRVTQPATLDNGCALDPNAVVAHVRVLKAIDFGGTNLIDAALAEVVAGNVDSDGSILGIGSPDPTVADATIGMSVQKAGRTTGKTTGSVEFVDVTIQVDYGNGRVATFANQIGCGGGGFSRQGDSGSLILSGDGKPLALLFAGGSGYTFGNRIQAVLDEFGVTVVGTGTAGGGNGGGKGGGGGNPGKGKKPKASEVKEKNSKALLAISGVKGHGVGKSGGKDVIVVFIDKDSATLRAKLPKSLDGIDVHVKVTGNVTAY